jgi:tetratricopeptide (TPR) repeat protein
MQLLRLLRGNKAAVRTEDIMMNAFMKGDYQTAALHAADLLFRGAMVMQLGQFQIARQLFQHVMDKSAEPKASALANSHMGQLLMEEGQHDRAMQYLRTAQILWQERGATDRQLAELWLRRGANYAEALRLARSAAKKDRAGEGLSPDTNNAILCENLATLAWAVAVESRDDGEVDQLLREAVSLSGANPVCSASQMHLHFGHAYAALGNMAKTMNHYEQAAQVDPNGLSGRAAAQLLAMAGQLFLQPA